MNLVVHVAPDPGRYERLVRAVHGGHFLRLRVLGVGLVLLGLAELIVFSSPGLGAIFLVGAAVTWFSPAFALRQGKRNGAGLVNGPWTYLLSDAGLSAHGPVSRSDLSWDAFEKARETDSDVLLYLSTSNVLGIPRHLLAPSEDAELQTFLRGRGLLS